MTIRSVNYQQDEILKDIASLHLKEGAWYEADITYGNGSFWRNLQCPRFCSDVEPTGSHVVRASATALPLASGAMSSIVCDLPFLTYVSKGRAHKERNVIMSARFSGYYRYQDLAASYRAVLLESARVLKEKGVLVFKCQDIVHNHQLHPTHIHAVRWAAEAGLRLLDLIVMPAKHRMPSPQKGTQRHARIYHSYFLVFTKGVTAGSNT